MDSAPQPAPAVSFERLAGSALGLMCGDALGMPVEGWTAAAIEARFGRLDSMQPGRLPAGSYTDDSQMMMAILETLAARGCLDGPYLARRFREGFEPRRGYGGRIKDVMQRLADGAAWDGAATDSFGNGGAMRVGPLGVFFADDEAALLSAALDQCRITHRHPQGQAGACALALGCGLAARLGSRGEAPEPAEFAEHLASRVEEIDAHVAARLRAMPPLVIGDEESCRRALAEEYICDVTAAEAVPPAVGAFLGARSAEQAVVLAVSLGGDTDTIGAMAGALAGAYFGFDDLPSAWLDALETGPRGADAATELCRKALAAKSG